MRFSELNVAIAQHMPPNEVEWWLNEYAIRTRNGRLHDPKPNRKVRRAAKAIRPKGL